MLGFGTGLRTSTGCSLKKFCKLANDSFSFCRATFLDVLSCEEFILGREAISYIMCSSYFQGVKDVLAKTRLAKYLA